MNRSSIPALIAVALIAALAAVWWWQKPGPRSSESAWLRMDVVTVASAANRPTAQVFAARGDTLRPGDAVFRSSDPELERRLAREQGRLAALGGSEGPGRDYLEARLEMAVIAEEEARAQLERISTEQARTAIAAERLRTRGEYGSRLNAAAATARQAALSYAQAKKDFEKASIARTAIERAIQPLGPEAAAMEAHRASLQDLVQSLEAEVATLTVRTPVHALALDMPISGEADASAKLLSLEADVVWVEARFTPGARKELVSGTTAVVQGANLPANTRAVLKDVRRVKQSADNPSEYLLGIFLLPDIQPQSALGLGMDDRVSVTLNKES